MDSLVRALIYAASIRVDASPLIAPGSELQLGSQGVKRPTQHSLLHELVHGHQDLIHRGEGDFTLFIPVHPEMIPLGEMFARRLDLFQNAFGSVGLKCSLEL
jgi:hypothetical protein